MHSHEARQLKPLKDIHAYILNLSHNGKQLTVLYNSIEKFELISICS